ncbi:MAG: DEAD/DEAH box helicase [Candidatus Eisenbacteria bacterium]|uniref:DEAD/DEAH box helicase n=1 Tax=Eiseniibacteriota bacterium TaxID=2212470 RepID=A0A948RXP1_UNCEI|nr:DEAD/DEAH box helicase [Candidatus Eisenbacteria bacterium]MBU1949125.1 DEAD/DEAH box helicase [Candidatus Eisenbacteria bacterium]MBU2692391.1 DEAD/DEAH box helicase [Candidatus Eisenbacteria bacterium]
MEFTIGALVKARGREWVVLPGSNEELLLLRPLGGVDDEIAGILTSLEPVEPASFDLPDPHDAGDYRSGRLLRDALRLGIRWSAGPFRCFGRIAVEPRPYQLVPLLMALKQDPVRLLIGDDVGIGKTVEASLIARELIDRGEGSRLAVLCPPHLAEQWQRELAEKFHLSTELVMAGTVRRLERQCRLGESLFERYPRVIVSIDYIKSDRRRDDFIRTCPDLVIVDEAHSCSYDEIRSRSRHQRYSVVKSLAADPQRHLILVTATPHSGKEAAFRSLLGFLDPEFSGLPEDLAGPAQASLRRRVAGHFVQRRRADIRTYMSDETVFPQRQDAEDHYKLSPAYRKLFNRVIDYARETVSDETGGRHRQRVRWWSALALLRSLASSPASAAATLQARSSSADTQTPEEADEIGRRQILDLEDSDAVDALDVIPGSDPGSDETDAEEADLPAVADAAKRPYGAANSKQAGSSLRRRLREMAEEAHALQGEQDLKLQGAVKCVRTLIREGYNPIIFCRFIPTAEYVAEQMRALLGNNVNVAAVTGDIPHAEREIRVQQLAQGAPRVLVCTDCLSEGINLQEHFNAVMHYDLSWNPTRHEQREGRVDRYGQASPTVRALTYYGIDNGIDGMVLDVLLRKHQTIRSSLGISVPVPVDTNAVVEAIFEGLLMRDHSKIDQMSFEFLRDNKNQLHKEWDDVTAREKRSRTMFAQEGIKVDDVARELEAARAAVGSGIDVERFLRDAIMMYGGHVEPMNSHLRFHLEEAPVPMREACEGLSTFEARFKLPKQPGEIYLSRTHPIVEGMADYVVSSALESQGGGKARRCGVIRTRDVEDPTTILLVRFRYHLIRRNGGVKELLAEEAHPLAFIQTKSGPRWLADDAVARLMAAKPSANIGKAEQVALLDKAIKDFNKIRPALDKQADSRGDQLLEAHRRVRAHRAKEKVTYQVRPELPADVLGLYLFLPAE